MELLCKIFGHRIDYKTLDTHRMTSLCKWCDKKLKVSYDMSYGQTIVTGDYGNQGIKVTSTGILVKSFFANGAECPVYNLSKDNILNQSDELCEFVYKLLEE